VATQGLRTVGLGWPNATVLIVASSDCAEGELAHVFISYVHQNRDVVDRLAKELRNRGVTVWLDRDDIEPGARWRDAIKKAIQTGKFFVACFSREYSERNQTHMNEELTLAIDELRARPSEKTWFLPVLINETHIPSPPYPVRAGRAPLI
jgi:5S rRNA maturation endonuclease (ribonuclease M5)